jgi:hypothetical protein
MAAMSVLGAVGLAGYWKPALKLGAARYEVPFEAHPPYGCGGPSIEVHVAIHQDHQAIVRGSPCFAPLGTVPVGDLGHKLGTWWPTMAQDLRVLHVACDPGVAFQDVVIAHGELRRRSPDLKLAPPEGCKVPSSDGDAAASGLAATGERRRGRIEHGSVTVEGPLTKDAVVATVRADEDALRACYQRGLRDNPQLSGHFTVSLLIGEGGGVASAGVRDLELPDSKVVTCIHHVLTSLVFPAPTGGVVKVSYPMLLRPR